MFLSCKINKSKLLALGLIVPVIAILTAFFPIAAGSAGTEAVLYENQVTAKQFTGKQAEVAEFVEAAASFSPVDYILPEFNHPGDLSNEDLIKTITLGSLVPYNRDLYSSKIITGWDVQDTAEKIFGPGAKTIQHQSVFPFDWCDSNQEYRIIGFGPGSYTLCYVIGIEENQDRYLVDIIFVSYYYTLCYPGDDCSPEFYVHDENGFFVADLSGYDFDDEPIMNYLHLFPVRRLILPKNLDGTYHISSSFILEQPHPAPGYRHLGELNSGDRVADHSWQWTFKTGNDYAFNPGDLTRPVTWVVVAKNHHEYDAGITLIAEDLIGLFPFDNSQHIDLRGDNHWGNSGTDGSATRGLRPWLNSTGIHGSEGFYNAFSEGFKRHLMKANVPNKTAQGFFYNTRDYVFVPSMTELGDVTHQDTYEIGTVFPYFKNVQDYKRAAILPEKGYRWYWTRSPTYIGSGVRSVGEDGDMFYVTGNRAHNSHCGVRPVLNLSYYTPVSSHPDHDGVYRINETVEDYPLPPQILDYHYTNPLVRGLPLRVTVETDRPNTHCSVTVGNKSVSRQSIPLGNRSVAVITVEDTYDFPAGEVEMTIEAGGHQVSTTLTVISKNSFSVVDNLELLRTASMESMREMSFYPGHAFLDILIKGAGLVAPIAFESLDAAMMAADIELKIMSPLRRSLRDTIAEQLGLMENEGYKYFYDFELEMIAFKDRLIEDIRGFIVEQISTGIYQVFCNNYNQSINDRHDQLIKDPRLHDLSLEDYIRINDIITIGAANIRSTGEERIYNWGNMEPTLDYFLQYQQNTSKNLFSRNLINLGSAGFQAFITPQAYYAPWIEVAPDKGKIADEITAAQLEAQSIIKIALIVYKVFKLIDVSIDAYFFSAMFHGMLYLSESIDYKHELLAEAIDDEASAQSFLLSIKAEGEQKPEPLYSVIDPEDISLKLIAEKVQYLPGEKVRLDLEITNKGSAAVNDCSWWVIAQEGDFFVMDSFSLDGHSEKTVPLEFKVDYEQLQVIHAGMVDGNFEPVAEDYAVIKVGEVDGFAAIITADKKDCYQPGIVDLVIHLENIGLETIDSPQLSVDGELYYPGIIEPGAKSKVNLSLEVDRPGLHHRTLSFYNRGEPLVSEIIWLRVEAHDELYAVNRMKEYTFQPGTEINIEAEIMNGRWEKTGYNYAVSVVAPCGEVIESASFIPVTEGVYFVKVSPEPNNSGYLCFEDYFHLVVGKPGELVVNKEQVLGSEVTLIVTNKYGLELGGVKVKLEDNTWITGPDGRVTVDVSSPGNRMLKLSKFPYYPSFFDLQLDQSALYWQNTETGLRYVYFYDGTGTDPAGMGGIGIVDPDRWNIVDAGDLDGNGKTDLIWHNTETGLLYAWLMDGLEVLSMTGLGEVANTAWKAVALGDMNGNGSLDVIWENSANGNRLVWYMEGTENKGFGSLPSRDPAWSIVAAADMNSSGHTDLLWQNESGVEREIWLMEGLEKISSIPLGPDLGQKWRIAAAGDFNANGFNDIIWEDRDSGLRYIWFMDGTGSGQPVDQGGLGTIDMSWQIAGLR